jgi:hypothetical protein
MRTWQNCQRGWWMTYYRGLRRKRELSKLPSVGILVHDVLEAYYSGRLESDVVGDVEQYVATRAAEMLPPNAVDEEAATVQESAELASIMLAGYFEWIDETGADAGLEVVGAEQVVRVPVGPYELLGKLDARVLRRTDGAVLSLEHKTVGGLTDIPRYAQTSSQFLTYDLLSAMTADARVDGLIINMLKRVKRTVRARPPFYARHEVRHNAAELQSHFKHVLAIGAQIEATTAALDAGADFHRVVAPVSGRSHLYLCPCAPVGALLDDGSNVEEYFNEFYEHVDPLARYAEESEEDGR